MLGLNNNLKAPCWAFYGFLTWSLATLPLILKFTNKIVQDAVIALGSWMIFISSLATAWPISKFRILTLVTPGGIIRSNVDLLMPINETSYGISMPYAFKARKAPIAGRSLEYKTAVKSKFWSSKTVSTCTPVFAISVKVNNFPCCNKTPSKKL